jgi:hypothetical protein
MRLQLRILNLQSTIQSLGIAHSTNEIIRTVNSKTSYSKQFELYLDTYGLTPWWYRNTVTSL